MIKIFMCFLCALFFVLPTHAQSNRNSIQAGVGFSYFPGPEIIGYNLKIGYNKNLIKRLGLFANGGNAFAEGRGITPKGDNIPYNILDITKSYPYRAVHQDRGLVDFQSKPVKYNSSFVNIGVSYDVFNTNKQSANIGFGFAATYTDYVTIEHVIDAVYDVFLLGKRDIIILVPRYDRFIDIGMSAQINYIINLDELLYLNPSASFMWYPGTDLSILTTGISFGVRF